MSDPLVVKRCMTALHAKYILSDDEARGMTNIVISVASQLWGDPPRQHDHEFPGFQDFADYFVKNYPGPDTVIYDPKWHAPKIYRAAVSAYKKSSQPQNTKQPEE